MDALRKQASKLREQVAKQQQAVIKQFSGSGYESSHVVVIDEVELQRHQQLEKLYRTTRAGKDFQKDIVRAAESFTNVGCKHIEVGTKFSEDCCRYGGENINYGELAKAASIYGSTLVHLEKEYEEFNRTLSLQIMEPLKQMVTGAPLEDARHLAQRYSRMRHEAELQAAEVSRRQLRVREAPIPENTAKLQMSEAKMHELKANMAVLGKEAAAALASVESQQQRLTLQRLVAMIDAEKSFHLRLAAILDEVEAEIVMEKQKKESAPPSAPNLTVSQSCVDKALYFLAEAMHPFEATSLNELSLSVGDYVVVRQQLKLDPIAQEGVFTSKGPRNTGSSTGFQTTFKESCNQPPIDDVQGDAVDEDNLSDIDDIEVGSYLHSEEEKQLKTIIWEKMNKEYIEEQAAKEAAAAAAKEAYDAAFANCSDDIRSAQELAAAATAAAVKFRKERKQKRAEEVKNSAPPRTAAEATRQMLKRKGFSSKINYDALDTLFTSDDGQKKKQHIESDNSDKPVKHDAEEQNELHDSSLKDYHNDHKAAHDTVEWDDDAGGEYDDDYNYGNEDDFEFELY